MAIRSFEERRLGGSGASFAAPVATHTAPDLRPLSATLGDWAAEVSREREAKGVARQQELAGAQQATMPLGQVAEPDTRLAFRFQEAFKTRAVELMAEQMKLDATRTAAELSRAHFDDPDGFAQAWGAYQESTLEVLQQSRPDVVPDVRLSLENYGNQGHQRLADQAFLREMQAQAQAHQDNYDARLATFSDLLLNDPDEARLQENLDELIGVADIGLANGVWGTAEAERAKARAHITLTSEYYRGQFNRSLTGGDVPGAQAVIESLLRGEGFEDNDRGRALANSLASELRATLGGESMSELVTLSKRQVSDMLAVRMEGGEVDDVAFTEALSVILSHGKPVDRLEAEKAARAHGTLQSLLPAVEQLPLSELPELRGLLVQGAETLPREIRDSLLRATDARMAKLEKARREETELDAVQPMSHATATARDLWDRVQRAEGVFGQPLNRLWDNQEVRRNAADFEDALRSGDFARASEIQQQALGQFGGSVSALVSEGLRHGQMSGPLFLTSMLQLAGADFNADELLMTYGLAQDNIGDLLTRHNDDLTRFRRDSDLGKAIEALSFGNPNLRQRLRDTLDTLYVGMLDQNDGRSAPARAEVKRLIAPFLDTVEFSNGATVPRLYLADHPRGTPAIVEEVDRHLDNPELLGFSAANDAAVSMVTPRRRIDGSIGFWSELGGRGFLTDPETGEEISIDPRRALESLEERERGTQSMREVVSRLKETGTLDSTSPIDTLATSLRAAPLKTAAVRLGVDSDLLQAIHFAGTTMSPDDVGFRTRFMLPPNAATEADWSRIEGAPGVSQIPPALKSGQHPDIAGLIAAERLDHATKTFPGDRRAQLAAYWTSTDAVQALQQEFGDRWFEEAPLDVKKFIANVEERL